MHWCFKGHSIALEAAENRSIKFEQLIFLEIVILLCWARGGSSTSHV